MRFLKNALAGVTALACALALTSYARAADDTLTAKNAAGSTITICSKDIGGGVMAACQQPINAAGTKINPATSDNQTTANTKLDTLHTDLGSIATSANQAAVQGSKAAGTAATNSLLIGGVYNTSLPSLTTGQQAAFQFDSSGRAIVNCGTGCASGLAQGSTTSGQTGGLVMGAATTSAPTTTTADSWPLSLDAHGALRVLNMDSTGAVIDQNAALPAGTNIIGKFTTDQTTHGTTDLVAADQTKVGGTAIATGNGVAGAGVQRVTIASDNTAFSVNLGTLNGVALDATVAETHGTKAAGTAATKSNLTGGVFNTSLPTLTTGQQAATQMDSSARTIVAAPLSDTKLDTLNTSINSPVPAGTNIIGKVTTDQTTHGTTDLVAGDITKVAGTAVSAANASAAENPILTGCEFKTTTTAATTGQKQFQACGDGFGNQGKSFTPAMATQITAQSATTGNTANAATLAAAASKFTYISGFACTVGGATAASLITVTVAGTITGSLTYTMAVPAGVTLAATPLIVSFPNPIQSSAVNTAITVTPGAAGSGNTVEQCNAQGFQQ